MKRSRFEDAECPVARSLDVIGDWWSLLIVRDAFDGIRRFGGFQKSLGIARGMLTTRLQALLEAGVLELAPASDGTAYQEYVLADKGRDLFPVIVALRQWGEDHLFREGERHSVLVDSEKGEPVTPLVIHARDGRALAWADTSVRKVGGDAVSAGASRPRRRTAQDQPEGSKRRATGRGDVFG